VNFLTSSEHCPSELLEEWKNKANLHKLKGVLRKTDKPSHPPRPKSEYIYFCEYMRKKIQEKMRKDFDDAGEFSRKISIQEVTCELGRQWTLFKQVPDPELKKQISELAELDKKRYHTEKDAMYKKEMKNDNHLKSKYLFYCKEERDKNPKISLTNIAALWKENKNDEKLTERYEIAKLESKKNQKVH
jgi:hypothetical protein